jgi:hypothetical protein
VGPGLSLCLILWVSDTCFPPTPTTPEEAHMAVSVKAPLALKVCSLEFGQGWAPSLSSRVDRRT